MIKSMGTPRGVVVIREATLADAEQFRELRLFALQESPTAFGADYQTSLNHPMSHWENRLKPDPNGTIILAEQNAQLIGMTGIRQGESAKTKHAARYGEFLSGRNTEACILAKSFLKWGVHGQKHDASRPSNWRL